MAEVLRIENLNFSVYESLRQASAGKNVISKIFGNLFRFSTLSRRNILENINLSLNPGETLCIGGPSGQGKSLLLRLIAGLEKPDSGNFFYFGEYLPKEKHSALEIALRQVGLVLQNGALISNLTVRDNVALPLRYHRRGTEKEISEKVNMALDLMRVSSVATNFPHTLSAGMLKRVAIARAISMNPKYLFCDEPNSGLDPKTSLVIDKLIQDITKEYNICTIVNSHDMNSIMEIGDNIIFLKNGKKEWQGSRFEIFDSNNESLNDFVFASDLFKKIKNATNNQSPQA